MSVTVRLGIWHGQVSIGMSLEDAAAVETFLGSSTMRLELMGDRTVRLCADPEGRRFTSNGQAEVDGNEVGITGPRDPSVETARCCNHWVDMAEHPMLPVLQHKLMPDHMLPWPKVRDCQSYWPPEEIFKEIVVRRKSCLSSGGRWTTPPGAIVSHLTPDLRVRLSRLNPPAKRGAYA